MFFVLPLESLRTHILGVRRRTPESESAAWQVRAVDVRYEYDGDRAMDAVAKELGATR
jgi:hypothetical protein